MTKLQKKKLKKKLKKNMQSESTGLNHESEPQQRQKEEVKKECKEEEPLERLRSYSLPNMKFNPEITDYQYVIERDFALEIQNYQKLKKETHIQKLRAQGKEDRLPLSSEKQRGPLIDEHVSVKICDLGNGCWTHYHFSQRIQTRQYRSPEVMLGADYDSSADMWSFACMVFELVTSDFLFEPRKGPTYGKTDDHLAQMMELLGPMPHWFALSGKHCEKFFGFDEFTGRYAFKKIQGL